MKQENMQTYFKSKIVQDIERNREIIEKVQLSKEQTKKAMQETLNSKRANVDKQK